MDRREILVLGAAAAASAALPRGAAAAATAPQAGAWRNHLDAYSRTLHWLRTPKEVADACHQIGNTTIDLTVRPYPGHVQPEKARTDLPLFVNALKAEGVTVTKIAMDVVDATTPNLEAVLDTQAQLGIRHIWWRGVPIDWTKPYPQALDATKPRVAALEKLLEKYKVKACWHPGGGFTEVLDVCRNFDPRYIAIDYDTGNFGQFAQGTLANQLRIAGPYVGSFVFKDMNYSQQTPEQQAAAAAAAAARRAQAGGGQGGAGGPPPGGGAPPAGGGAARAPAPGGGGAGGNGNGWISTQVPIGTGVVNIPLVCATLKEINFQGPIECQPEWAAIDGAGQGLDKLSIPAAEVIRMLKRDFDTVSGPLKAAGVI